MANFGETPHQVWITGTLTQLQQIISAWPALVDTDDLRSTPVPIIRPTTLAAQHAEMLRVAYVNHAPGLGATLVEHLRMKLRELGVEGSITVGMGIPSQSE